MYQNKKDKNNIRHYTNFQKKKNIYYSKLVCLNPSYFNPKRYSWFGITKEELVNGNLPGYNMLELDASK